MKKTTYVVLIFALFALLSLSLFVKTSSGQQTSGGQATTDRSLQSAKDCLSGSLPGAVVTWSANGRDVTVKMAGAATDATMRERIRNAVCKCTPQINSVAIEDPEAHGNAPIIIVTSDCNSRELAQRLYKELSGVLSEGDVVRAKVKNQEVTLSGTVGKKETVKAAYDAAVRAGARKVSVKNLSVRKQYKR